MAQDVDMLIAAIGSNEDYLKEADFAGSALSDAQISAVRSLASALCAALWAALWVVEVLQVWRLRSLRGR